MSTIQTHPTTHATKANATDGRLFALDLSGNRVFSVNDDGSSLVTGCRLPDAICTGYPSGRSRITSPGRSGCAARAPSTPRRSTNDSAAAAVKVWRATRHMPDMIPWVPQAWLCLTEGGDTRHGTRYSYRVTRLGAASDSRHG
jgi:hypothetical protein